MEPKLLLLGLLRQQKMHGYQLYEFIERDLAVCTDLKKPTAYYLLGKMAEDGWIDEEQVQEGNRPPRRVYHLTALGQEAFQRLLRANLSDYSPAFFPGDASLAFMDALDAQDAHALLSQRRRLMADALDALRSVPAHQGSLQIVIDHRRSHLEAELVWLDMLLENLVSREKT